MGRKPNQLILEFFERGQKLEDASNRYQHTCKSCGERFPKGRIDSLTTHLFKKCPAIPLKDRQRAFMQLHDLPDGESPEANASGGKEIGGKKSRGIGKGQTVDLPIGTRNWTALETLAEVSRQIDLNENTRDGSPSGEAGHERSREGSAVVSEKGPNRGRRRSAKKGSSLAPGSKDDKGGLAVSEGTPTNRATSSARPELPPIQLSGLIFDSPSTSPRLPGLSLPETVINPIDPALQTITSSITAQQIAGEVQNVLAQPGRTLEPELPTAPQDAGLSDKFFHPQTLGPRPASTWPLMHPSGQSPGPDMAFFDGSGSRDLPGGSGIIDGLAMRAATFPRAIAMNPDAAQRDFTSEFSATNRTMRPKVRGRFTATRRKEVQEVRKRGACIRCRMLKKPCSGASPCSTCRSVESARLWKQPCIRTRVADELDIYSAGLYTVLAHHSISHIKSLFAFPPPPTTLINAAHLPSSTVSLDCLAIISQPLGHSSASPLTSPIIHILDSAVSTSTTTTATDAQSPFTSPTALQTYLLTLIPHLSLLEPASSFITPTLTLASTLSSQKSDTLLTRVLELWTATTLLVSPSLTLSLSSTTLPPPPDDEGHDAPPSDAHPPQPLDPSSDSHRLISTQLSSILETRCAALSKSILHELERRLLQRAQTGWFETFLVAVLLLNAVERACWGFHTWEVSSSDALEGAKESDKGNWPLDKQPGHYIERAERFSEMLGVLLRMRGLPPKTLGSVSGATNGEGKAEEDPAGGGEELMARGYLEGVSRDLLSEGQGRETEGWDREDMRVGEGRFVAKLLMTS